MDYPCVFFPGPAVTGDIIMFMCENEIIGVNVTIQIQSENEAVDTFVTCDLRFTINCNEINIQDLMPTSLIVKHVNCSTQLLYIELQTLESTTA